MKNVALSFSLLALPLFAACGSPAPSSKEAEAAVSQRVDRDSEGRMRLVAFERTNGQQGELAGIPFYSVEFTAELEVLQDCKWLTSELGRGRAGFKTAATVRQAQADGGFWASWFNMSQTAGTDYKKGQRLSFLGSILFEQSEKGWRSSRLEITKAYPSLPPHVGANHRELLIEWFSAHPFVRLATLEDCRCDDDFKAARSGGYINEHPYYVAGDFNGDGTADLAVTVIDTRKDPESGLVRNASGAVTGYNQEEWFNAGMVIFNGPLRPGMQAAFVGETVGTPQGAVLFFDAERKLRVGNFSSGSLVRVIGGGYSLK